MGFMAKAGAFFGRLFGSENAVENVIGEDGLLVKTGRWIDEQQFTDQERVEYHMQLRQWATEQLSALSQFKVVQRIIAFVILPVWAVGALLMMGAVVIQAFVNRCTLAGQASGKCSASDVPLELTEPLFMFLSSDYMLWPTVTVLALYCSGGVIESVKRKLN